MIQRSKDGRFVNQMFREFKLFTNGDNPGIDRLSVICECFDEMDNNEKVAALGYIDSRFCES